MIATEYERDQSAQTAEQSPAWRHRLTLAGAGLILAGCAQVPGYDAVVAEPTGSTPISRVYPMPTIAVTQELAGQVTTSTDEAAAIEQFNTAPSVKVYNYIVGLASGTAIRQTPDETEPPEPVPDGFKRVVQQPLMYTAGGEQWLAMARPTGLHPNTATRQVFTPEDTFWVKQADLVNDQTWLMRTIEPETCSKATRYVTSTIREGQTRFYPNMSSEHVLNAEFDARTGTWPRGNLANLAIYCHISPTQIGAPWAAEPVPAQPTYTG